MQKRSTRFTRERYSGFRFYLCLHFIGVRALFGQQWLVPFVDDKTTPMTFVCLGDTSQCKVVVSYTYVASTGREIKTRLRRD